MPTSNCSTSCKSVRVSKDRHDSKHASLRETNVLANRRRCSPFVKRLTCDGISTQALPTAVTKKPMTSQRKFEDNCAAKSSMVESLFRSIGVRVFSANFLASDAKYPRWSRGLARRDASDLQRLRTAVVLHRTNGCASARLAPVTVHASSRRASDWTSNWLRRDSVSMSWARIGSPSGRISMTGEAPRPAWWWCKLGVGSECVDTWLKIAE